MSEEGQSNPLQRIVRRGAIHYAETAFGFEYGAAAVERACSDAEKGWVLLLVRTPKYPDGLQVYVTKTGKVRVHAAGKEWKPPSNAVLSGPARSPE